MNDNNMIVHLDEEELGDALVDGRFDEAKLAEKLAQFQNDRTEIVSGGPTQHVGADGKPAGPYVGYVVVLQNRP